MRLLILRFRHHGPGTGQSREGGGGRYGPGGVLGGAARRAAPTSLKEPARLRHQPGACALIRFGLPGYSVAMGFSRRGCLGCTRLGSDVGG